MNRSRRIAAGKSAPPIQVPQEVTENADFAGASGLGNASISITGLRIRRLVTQIVLNRNSDRFQTYVRSAACNAFYPDTSNDTERFEGSDMGTR